ncbi:MAG: glycosyltransferase, partial [Dehalococcoidia bacterium]
MSHRKKILWLIKGLGLGGAERLLATALPHVDRNVFSYEVAYFLPWKNDLVPEFEQADIPVACLNLGKPYNPMGLFRLTRFLREREIDILHCHLPYSGVLGRVAGRLAGVKGIVYTEHNVLEMYHPITRFCNVLTSPLNDVTIAVSEEVQRSVLKRWAPARRTVATICNGVDLNSLGPNGVRPEMVKEALGIPGAHRVVGNVAHVRPEKGQEYFLQAAKLVLDKCPDVTFVIVGREKTNGELHRLRELATQLRIQDKVIFAGFREDVLHLMTTFDVFVLSSLHEGLPVALLEAMALGKPSVATRVGGVPEVIDDGVNGFLVQPRDPTGLAE